MSSVITTLRGPKFIDMAIFDWIATILGALWIWYALNQTKDVGFEWFLLILVAFIALGVVVHLIFRVDTKFGFYLGLNSDPRPNAMCTNL